MLLANLLQTAFNIIDMLFVGRLGPEAIAAVAMSGAIIHMIMTLVIGVDMGMRALVARFYGAEEIGQARRVAGQALLLGGILTLFLASGGAFWRRDLLMLLGAQPQVVDLGSSYLLVLFGGIITMVYMFFVSGILQSIGDAKTPMRVGALAFVVNILLDPLLIFGWGPVPAYGVAGAAWATVLSRGLAGVMLLAALFNHTDFRVKLADLKPDFPLLRRIGRIALPGALQIGCYSGSDIFSTRLLAVFGTTTVAAFGVANRSVMLLMIVGFGLGGAAATLVGQNLGAGQTKRAEQSVWIISGLYAIVLAFGTVGYYWGAPAFIGAFTSDKATLALGVDCIRIFCFGFIFMPFNLIFGRALQGAGDTLSPLFITALCRLPLLLGLLYWLPRHFAQSTDGLWYSFLVALVVEGLLKLAWFQRGAWKTQQV
jgi:putative MATE family efflux protein